MGDMVPIRQGGDMMSYNPAGDIANQLALNYRRRGEAGALLAVAALTETAGFNPVVDGREFGMDVVEGPWRHPDDTGPHPTIEEARNVLAEYVKAPVDGADRLKLTTLPTFYREIAKGLWPGRRTPAAHAAAFNEGLLEQAALMGVGLDNPNQASAIIRRAPRGVVGLLLSNRRPTAYGEDNHDFVTVGGHLLRAYSDHRRGEIEYYLASSPNQLSSRGGRAPDRGIGGVISRRVVQLRTASSRR